MEEKYDPVGWAAEFLHKYPNVRIEIGTVRRIVFYDSRFGDLQDGQEVKIWLVTVQKEKGDSPNYSGQEMVIANSLGQAAEIIEQQSNTWFCPRPVVVNGVSWLADAKCFDDPEGIDDSCLVKITKVVNSDFFDIDEEIATQDIQRMIHRR